MPCLAALAVLVMLAASGMAHAASVTVFAESPGPMVRFALGDLEKALVVKGDTLREGAESEAQILLVRAPAPGRKLPALDFDLKPEGFCLRPDKAGKVWGIGADEAGQMYGVLELAEQIRLNGLSEVRTTSQPMCYANLRTRRNRTIAMTALPPGMPPPPPASSPAAATGGDTACRCP